MYKHTCVHAYLCECICVCMDIEKMGRLQDKVAIITGAGR